jgi:hypothetical protein
VKPLCQREVPGTSPASCGACCGVYNFADHSREAVTERLLAHTEAIARAPRTPEGFRAAARELAAGEGAPLFPPVRVCPLLGFLDAAHARVGCLAHPLSTGGQDLRDCGVYDAHICETFFCPSHSWLSEEEAALVVRVCADFYLYGLVVTDVPFVRAALAAVAEQVGARVTGRHAEDPGFRGALRRLFGLKEELEPGSEGLYGAFTPGGKGEPVPRRIDYVEIGRSRSAFDEILVCVGADPRSGNDLDALEGVVRERLAACARAFPG